MMSWTKGKLLVTSKHELVSYALLNRNRIETPLLLSLNQGFQPDTPRSPGFAANLWSSALRSPISQLVTHARLRHVGERTARSEAVLKWNRALMSPEKSAIDRAFRDREPQRKIRHCHALNPRQMAANDAQKQSDPKYPTYPAQRPEPGQDRTKVDRPPRLGSSCRLLFGSLFKLTLTWT